LEKKIEKGKKKQSGKERLAETFPSDSRGKEKRGDLLSYALRKGVKDKEEGKPFVRQKKNGERKMRPKLPLQ